MGEKAARAPRPPSAVCLQPEPTVLENCVVPLKDTQTQRLSEMETTKSKMHWSAMHAGVS